jgi:uncharacterized protein YbjT (DUF2867 family)
MAPRILQKASQLQIRPCNLPYDKSVRTPPLAAASLLGQDLPQAVAAASAPQLLSPPFRPLLKKSCTDRGTSRLRKARFSDTKYRSSRLISSAERAGPAWRRRYAMTTVVVFGGSGFLGRRLVRRLARDGLNVRVAVRHPAPARSILKAAGLDRVMVQRADVCDQTTVAAAIAGADAAVNAVSAYVERGGETFEAAHVRGAETVARGAAAAGVARLVLVSGIGADPESRSPYIRARGRGERAVQREFPGATIVRPSAMFGPGDALFGTLADLGLLLPMLPLIGAGRTRLQPVYVEDVAEAVARMLADPVTASQTYETTGPNVYTLRELVGITLRLIGRRRLLVPVPFAIAEVLARLFEFLPSPPLTTGQVDLLRMDNVASGTLRGLQNLNIQPKGVEEVVPSYIGRPHASESY